MKRILKLNIALVSVATLAAGAPASKDTPKPDSKLVGRWTAVRSFHGDTETTENPSKLEYEFTADGKWITRREGKEYKPGPGRYTTD